MFNQLDRRYALAIYQVAEEKAKVQEMLSELEQVVTLIKSSEELQNIIKHPQINTVHKKEIFTKVFKGKLSDELVSFLMLLIEKGRISEIEQILLVAKEIHLEKNNTVIANVTTVVPMDEAQIEKLKEKLSKKYNKKIVIQTEIDKTILGGLYIKVGDDVIDATLKLKLEEMKKLMFEH